VKVFSFSFLSHICTLKSHVSSALYCKSTVNLRYYGKGYISDTKYKIPCARGKTIDCFGFKYFKKL
jgi:hypothetical protein